VRTQLLFVAWLLACGGGIYGLSREAGQSATNASAPITWPVSARVPHAGGRATLVLFAHSRCACTRATIRELERLVARTKDHAADVLIVLSGPAGDGPTSIGALARGVVGANVVEDDGSEATRFGVKASGQVLVYGGDGRLRFNGGITPSRGHEGDSRGAELALRALTSSPPSSSADVFGCGIATKEP
jgi:hypothetical protein